MGILQCKKNEIPMISEIESQILAFFDSSLLIQNSKLILILYLPFENSTTRIAITLS